MPTTTPGCGKLKVLVGGAWVTIWACDCEPEKAATIRATSVATGNISTGGTIAQPTGKQTSDLLVLAVVSYPSSTLTTPAGWTAYSTKVNATSTVKMWIFTKIAVAGSDSATLTFNAATYWNASMTAANASLVEASVNNSGENSASFSTAAGLTTITTRTVLYIWGGQNVGATAGGATADASLSNRFSGSSNDTTIAGGTTTVDGSIPVKTATSPVNDDWISYSIVMMR